MQVILNEKQMVISKQKFKNEEQWSKDLIVSILNNVLENCFEKKQIDEEFNGDIVGDFGIAYDEHCDEIYSVLFDSFANYQRLYDRLINKSENPITILNLVFDWNIEEGIIHKKKVIQAYEKTLNMYGFELKQ